MPKLIIIVEAAGTDICTGIQIKRVTVMKVKMAVLLKLTGTIQRYNTPITVYQTAAIYNNHNI